MALLWLSMLAGALIPYGCSSSEKRLTYFGRAKPLDYRDHQLEIDEPPEPTDLADPTAGLTMRPRTIADRSHDEIWNLSLADAIQLALANNRIARTRNEFLSPGNPTLANPEGVGSIFDPAIRETGFLFGNRGVESSLSAFDPILATNFTSGSSETIQNNPILSGGIPAGRTLFQDTSQLQASLTKNMAYGGTVQVQQNFTYSDNNQPFQLFHSNYSGNLQFNYQQPLLAGSGTDFNRISGPLGTNIQGVSGLNQGVAIARINTDISLVDFESQIRNMVHDVEDLYWDLYLAYRNYDSLVAARNIALKAWQKVKSKSEAGLAGGGTADEAQAREQFFEARGRTETALYGAAGRGGDQGVYGIELQLRRMCGLPANDGRVIRPSDDPTVAQVVYNWDYCLATAFARRQELRKQRWIVKSVELQLQAAKNLARPQFNFVSQYQINGFGKDLFGDNGKPGTPGAQIQNYFRTLYAADQTGWNLGFQFSVPLGMRNAQAQVRNTELRLMKAQAVLAAQENEVSHELASAFQSLDYLYQNAQANYNRREAAGENLVAIQEDYDASRKPLDALLQAQNRLAIGDMAFYKSIIDYNKALSELQLRQGTLLEYNNIHLEEREWLPQARVEAMRRAWARSYAFDALPVDPVHHEPEAFVLPRQRVPQVQEPADGAGSPLELTPGNEVPPDRPLFQTPPRSAGPVEVLEPSHDRSRELEQVKATTEVQAMRLKPANEAEK